MFKVGNKIYFVQGGTHTGKIVSIKEEDGDALIELKEDDEVGWSIKGHGALPDNYKIKPNKKYYWVGLYKLRIIKNRIDLE